MKRGTTLERNALAWYWMKGRTTFREDFGDPVSRTSYRLCVYDGAGTLLASARTAAGGAVDGRPLWKATARGFIYADRTRAADGLARIVLSEGLTDGKAQIVVKARGTHLRVPDLTDVASPLLVQLVNSDGACWSDSYAFPPAARVRPNEFKDRPD